uniref:Uncharacterized protein n=1 Tax=Pyrodinium bahamense TaxID=73915 RepID=A0A7S0AB45_9DINO
MAATEQGSAQEQLGLRPSAGSAEIAAGTVAWRRDLRAAGLGAPAAPPPDPLDRAGRAGLARSKSVVERLDARFRGAELFDRRAIDDDGEWPMDDVLRSLAESKQRRGDMHLLRKWTEEFAREPRLRVVVASAGGGAIVLGSLGGSCGLVAGAVAGALAGAVPAVFTLGLSIPAGAVAGGILGCCTGVVTCTGVGLVGAGLAGGAAYDLCIGTEAPDFPSEAGEDSEDEETHHSGELLRGIREVARAAGNKASELGRGAQEAVLNRKLQVTAISAAGGAVTLGAGGGAAGWMAGGAIGGAVGFIPALLTFGLSIPVCATVGSGAGLCAGTALGSAAGLVGGGAAGYGAYALGRDLHCGLLGSTVNGCTEYMRGKAQASASYVATRCIGGTGGT